MMKRSLLLSTFAILGLVLASGVHADDGDGQKRGRAQAGFVGLWSAIDIFDGSTQRLSITCPQRDACDVRLNDTAFTLSCPNQTGVAWGEGTISGRVLTVELSLCCTTPSGCTPAGSQVNEFVLNRKDGTLTNLNDDPVPQPNVFHKISN